MMKIRKRDEISYSHEAEGCGVCLYDSNRGAGRAQIELTMSRTLGSRGVVTDRE